METLSDSWLDSLLGAKILIVLGAGGVGKTTTSAALALKAAKRGLKVGLLSIDPAKRLADALGIKLSANLSVLPLSPEYKGSLDAAMLDQKVVFDEVVKRFVSDPKTQARIFDNRLYQAVSQSLGGPLEYMALAKLESMVRSQAYDLVILDTPPDTHAIDFLLKPNVLSGFMEHKVMTWLIKPFYIARRMGVQKLLQAGERLMGGIAAVTGIKALNTLAELLVLLDDVIKGLHQAGSHVDELLRLPSTHFALVSAPSSSATRSAAHLLQQLKDHRFPLRYLLWNQSLSPSISQELEKEPDSEAGPAETLAYELLQTRAKQEARLRSELEQKLHAEGTRSQSQPFFILKLYEKSKPLESREDLEGLLEV